jgi:hypothetical protein
MALAPRRFPRPVVECACIEQGKEDPGGVVFAARGIRVNARAGFPVCLRWDCREWAGGVTTDNEGSPSVNLAVKLAPTEQLNGGPESPDLSLLEGFSRCLAHARSALPLASVRVCHCASTVSPHVGTGQAPYVLPAGASPRRRHGGLACDSQGRSVDRGRSPVRIQPRPCWSRRGVQRVEARLQGLTSWVGARMGRSSVHEGPRNPRSVLRPSQVRACNWGVVTGTALADAHPSRHLLGVLPWRHHRVLWGLLHDQARGRARDGSLGGGAEHGKAATRHALSATT